MIRGVVCAGGTATRLGELTKITNKHLLPVGPLPMIYYPLVTLQQAGIKEICLVTGKEHAGDFIDRLGDGKICSRGSNECLFDLDITYRVQTEAGGIAQAVSLATNFANNEKIVVILGDNIIEGNIIQAVEDFKRQKNGAKIFLREVLDPERFGVAEIKEDKIIRIVEKPKKPKTNLAVVGIYMYDVEVFKIIKGLKPSGRGELEITDVNNAYIEKGNMTFEILEGWWRDAGTYESLSKIGSLIEETGVNKRRL